MKALRRLLLRCVYPFTGLLRLFRRRAPVGATMAVVWEGRVLVCRHTYRAGHALPGGRVKRGEDPMDAAIRELREEIGIEADPARVRPVYQDLWTRIFEYRPARRPKVRIDEVEIEWAEFVDASDVEDATGTLRNYLLCRAHDLRGSGRSQ